MLLHDMQKFHFKAFQRFAEHKDKFLAQFVRENIEWGKKEGYYREDIDVDVMVKFRIESMMIPFNVIAYPPVRFKLANVSEIILEHFMYGMATVKGHELIEHYRQLKSKNQPLEASANN
jgi:hypothetical protein